MPETIPIILYLSAILGQPVRGASGEIVGKVTDMVVRMTETEMFPPVTGLVTAAVGRSRLRFFVHAGDITEMKVQGVHLKTDQLNLAPFTRRDSEVLLSKDVLDKQLVDINGRRVIRVNDVTLTLDPSGPVYRVAGVDVSAASLIDRLGLRRLAQGMQREVIPWDSVQYFASEVPVVTLKLSYDKLARLHPADLAEIITDLGYQQGGEMIAALAETHGDELAAETIEELDPELGAAVMSALDVEDAADILEEMDSDEAADLLAEMSPEQAADILEAMEHEEAEEVRELLRYGEDTAGGMMSTDFLAVPASRSVGDTLALLRAPDPPEFTYYLYVINAEEVLEGVVSLRSLLQAADEETLSVIMTPVTSVITAQVDEPARQVAEAMVHYNLLAMPILDAAGHLVGIVQTHDALERLIPDDAQRTFYGGSR